MRRVTLSTDLVDRVPNDGGTPLMKREYFALMATCALLSNPEYTKQLNKEFAHVLGVKVADGLIAELNKGKS